MKSKDIKPIVTGLGGTSPLFEQFGGICHGPDIETHQVVLVLKQDGSSVYKEKRNPAE